MKHDLIDGDLVYNDEEFEIDSSYDPKQTATTQGFIVSIDLTFLSFILWLCHRMFYGNSMIKWRHS